MRVTTRAGSANPLFAGIHSAPASWYGVTCDALRFTELLSSHVIAPRQMALDHWKISVLKLWFVR